MSWMLGWGCDAGKPSCGSSSWGIFHWYNYKQGRKTLASLIANRDLGSNSDWCSESEVARELCKSQTWWWKLYLEEGTLRDDYHANRPAEKSSVSHIQSTGKRPFLSSLPLVLPPAYPSSRIHTPKELIHGDRTNYEECWKAQFPEYPPSH